MKLDHISVTLNDKSDGCYYRIKAEVDGIPEKQWQDGLKFVWYNSSYYLCKKSELAINGNEIELLLEDSNDIQNAVDALSDSVSKADKMVKSYGITNISPCREAIN